MRRPGKVFLAVTAFALAACGAARADDTAAPGGLRPLCPDRPSKGTAACTVDAGHLQLESDFFNATYDRSDGVSTHTYLFTNPTLKFGVSDNFDIEASLAPYVRIVTHAPAMPATTSSGIGDLFLRAKLNLVGNAGGALAVALEPYGKAPTAGPAIGDGAWEEGLLAPVSYNLPHGWSLGLTPEADVLLNGSGSGRHLQLSLPVGLGHAIGPLAGTIELWTAQNFDPAGTVRQYSLDFAAAWQPSHAPNIQIDGGVNVGLNRATPDVQLYVGAAKRF